MFCLPGIIIYRYSETNVMHFVFNLLRIKGLYMFRTLSAYPQEALHKRHDILRACYGSWLHQYRSGNFYSNPSAPTDITRTQYIKFRLFSAS
jgi:hypothetical protein